MSPLSPAPGRPPSLRNQLMALLLVMVALSLTITMLGSLVMAWDLQQRQITRSLVTTARSAAIAVSAAVAFNDERAAAEALSILVPQREITAAAVFRLNGRRLAQFGDAARLPVEVQGQPFQEPELTPLSMSTHLLMPIDVDGSTLGHLYLHANLEEHRAGYLRQTLVAVLSSLLALGLAVWLGLRFVDRTTRPLRRLAEVAGSVGHGDNFSLRAPEPTPGTSSQEINALVFSFNAMLAELEIRDLALSEYRRDLELRVGERTQQLALSNAALSAEIRVREATEAQLRANEALLQAQKQSADDANQAKSRFLAAASHDLRQPMHAMGLLISTLRARLEAADACADPGAQPELVGLAGRIDAAVVNMATQLNDLLDLSRIDAGVVVPQVDCVRLGSVLDHLDSRFQPVAAEKGLRLRIVSSALAARTDAVLLERILANLIENALRYTPRGGVLVGVRRRGEDTLHIEVLDSGAGIPEAMSARVFEEYFQLGNPERDRQKGLGLGLSIVKRLSALLDMPVQLRSRVGQGTRFTLELPRCAVRASGPRTEPPPMPAALPVQGKLVVLIEDDEAILVAARVLFAQWGIELVAESSLESLMATLAARHRRPDLVLTDYRLPGACDGIGVMQRLRAEFGDNLPGVLITGDTGEDALRTISQSGLVAMHKPLHPAKLRALLEHMLR